MKKIFRRIKEWFQKIKNKRKLKKKLKAIKENDPFIYQ